MTFPNGVRMTRTSLYQGLLVVVVSALLMACLLFYTVSEYEAWIHESEVDAYPDLDAEPTQEVLAILKAAAARP